MYEYYVSMFAKHLTTNWENDPMYWEHFCVYAWTVSMFAKNVHLYAIVFLIDAYMSMYVENAQLYGENEIATSEEKGVHLLFCNNCLSKTPIDIY